MANIDKLSNKEKLSHIIECAFKSLVGQLIVDKDGIVLFYSDEHEKYIGIRKEDAIGKHVTEVVPHTQMHVIAQTGEPDCGMIFFYEHKETGELTPAICNRTPIIENDEVIGVMSETTFTKGFNDVNILAEELKKVNFNFSKNKYGNDSKIDFLDQICGSSPQMMNLKATLLKFSDLNLPALITGETGTGKEVFANTLHQMSYRKDHPFVKINCAAIPGQLLESELFGYTPGAFSGALKEGKKGKFEHAKDGTILLDEIGDMPMELQSKLLRVLQEKEFEKIGGLKSIPFNARVICTTNRDIEQLIAEGKFREDLFYRINVLEIKIPPLRERITDLIPLINFFIKEMNYEEGTSIEGIDPKALDALQNYSWPGNVRELKHVMQRACVLAGAGTLTVDDFDFFIKKINVAKGSDWESKFDEDFTIDVAKSKAEIIAIKKALEKANNNKSNAAVLLGIDRTVLYSKMKKYGL